MQGAAIASSPGARTLRLIACPGVETVSVAVTRAGQGDGAGSDCATGGPRRPAFGRRAWRRLSAAQSARCAARRSKITKRIKKAKSKRQKKKLRRKLRKLGC